MNPASPDFFVLFARVSEALSSELKRDRDEAWVVAPSRTEDQRTSAFEVRELKRKEMEFFLAPIAQNVHHSTNPVVFSQKHVERWSRWLLGRPSSELERTMQQFLVNWVPTQVAVFEALEQSGAHAYGLLSEEGRRQWVIVCSKREKHALLSHLGNRGLEKYAKPLAL